MEENTKDFIVIKGARIHNLKNIHVSIPRNKLIVLTGLSGSGKSSLAFDTLYAEGQRRYVESLSSYARQFLGRLHKPEVDSIKGISPAIAIEQKVNTRNPRSTVGTSTEIYDYLKLLYARIGKTISPVSGKIVKRHTVSDVCEAIACLPEGTRLHIGAVIQVQGNEGPESLLNMLNRQGFSRVKIKGTMVLLSDESRKKYTSSSGVKTVELIVDRVKSCKPDDETSARWADSIQTAFYEGHGACFVENADEEGYFRLDFSNRFEADGIVFEEPGVHFFSFNNPLGACKTCDGFGTTIGIDPDLVIPDKSLSLYEGVVAPWRGEVMKEWKEDFIKKAGKKGFPIHRPYSELSKNDVNLLWNGDKNVEGINRFFEFLEEQAYKIQYRVMLSRYRGKTVCPECMGARLRKDAGYVKVAGISIHELVLMNIHQVRDFFNKIELDEHDREVSKRLLIEIQNRLGFLIDVGLGYLTLNRMSNTLSGGESQRINLAGSLGSSLVGSLYILDEPSIGLHPRDTDRLIGVLKSLRNMGNTVIVVEHDEEIMKQADQLIDIGPGSGMWGGKLVFQGNWKEKKKGNESLTLKYLNGEETIPVPAQRRKWKDSIIIKGARENNLKNLTVRFPLGVFTVVTGVSGSGKSSLVKKILYPSLKKILEGYAEQTGSFDKLEGDVQTLEAIEFVDQNPIGKSSRSNPVTYVKAYDEIRSLFAEQALSKLRGYKPSTFSFNVEGGRCEVCQGEGTVRIEMQFMSDIELPCENCQGKRFKPEIREVLYRDKSITDLLEMTIDEAIIFFESEVQNNTVKKILNRLRPLADTGLGYMHLGQSSNTLSGGEAQRIKLASFLIKGENHKKTLFIFDEPTTGLHFHDIQKLLHAFEALLDQGHTLVVVEHNQEMIKSADWIIDLGPEGGEEGGELIYEGVPEGIVKSKKSYTGKYLSEKF